MAVLVNMVVSPLTMKLSFSFIKNIFSLLQRKKEDDLNVT